MAIEQSEMFLETTCELLRDGLRIRFCATGQSMKPTINDGEIIVIEPIEVAKIKHGDIILYRTPRGVIAHRIVDIACSHDQPTFILRGDSLAADDCPVAARDILGRVVGVERNGRTINLSGRYAQRWAVIKLFLYKFRLRIETILKALLKS